MAGDSTNTDKETENPKETETGTTDDKLTDSQKEEIRGLLRGVVTEEITKWANTQPRPPKGSATTSQTSQRRSLLQKLLNS